MASANRHRPAATKTFQLPPQEWQQSQQWRPWGLQGPHRAGGAGAQNPCPRAFLLDPAHQSEQGSGCPSAQG